MNAKLVIGIVTFNPNISLLEKSLDKLLNYNVFIFDNGSSNIKLIDNIVINKNNFFIMHSDINIGIAAALNRIFTNAIQKKYDLVLTLDQDSICSENLINGLLEHANAKQIGIVCPTFQDRNLPKIEIKKTSTYVDWCISSASLIKINCWKAVNGFDESMFIDSVDYDFCLRIRKKGFLILQINDYVLSHAIGFTISKRLFFLKVLVRNHSSFRKYFIGRNIIYCARKSHKKILILKAYLRIMKQLFLVLLFENEKKRKILSLINGFKDGRKCEIPKKWSY